ncbi:undecaprenyl-diphosphate phosphatase [candidate division WWE3 bacterium]|nr:undecaprenyl-diphosphate phosphatase [candidate division WWE3 bacterium]
MEWWYAMLLGIVQGVSEFLPISSSGHLLLLAKFVAPMDQGLAVDAFLHLASATAIIIYFYDDWISLVRNWKNDSSLKKLIAAALPAALVGVLFGDAIESFFRSAWVVAVMLVVVAGLMWWVEANYTQVKHTETKKKKHDIFILGWRDAVIIGLSQVFALIPGTSRSGITMSTGMIRRLTREQAARFSFMLGVPISMGAGLLQLPEVLADPTINWNILGIATLTTLAVALATIHYFLKLISKLTFKPFAIYRVVLAVIVVLTLII